MRRLEIALQDWLKVEELESHLTAAPLRTGEVGSILETAALGKGLSLQEAAVLLASDETEQLDALARKVRRQVFGIQMSLFAPLYLSNACVNDCLYCGFRRSNKSAARKTLTLEEILAEVEYIVRQGHRHLLLVSSENPHLTPPSYIAKAVQEVLSLESVRQVDIEIGSLDQEQMEELSRAGAVNYVLFQETYQPETYACLHPKGLKTDFNWRLSSPERAMKAGLGVGLGALLGLCDWRYETLALIAHAQYLRKVSGKGPASISVPRLRPADGAVIQEPPFLVRDGDLKRIISVLRLALPEVNIVLSTREPAWLRDELVDSGVTTMSAGSRTNPGGYSLGDTGEQFPVEDHRSLAEVVDLIKAKGFKPVL